MKSKHFLIIIGILFIGGLVYYFWLNEIEPEYDGFAGWEKFGLNETYDVGDFIPIRKNQLKSPVVTSQYLSSQDKNNDNLLQIKVDKTFDSKRVDYTSTFNSSINANSVSLDFKQALASLKKVNFDVYGGKQKRLAKGTVVLSEIIRSLPNQTVENMKQNLETFDSIIFITEVMEYDSSKYQISWENALSPQVRQSIDGDLQTLGTNGSWMEDKGYVIVSNQPKNFLYKFEPLTESMKELIFKKNREIVEAREAQTRDFNLLPQPVQVLDWKSDMINRDSWRFEHVNAYLNPKGVLKLSGIQSSNAWEGFTAAINVIFLDKNQNPINSIITGATDVIGKDSRDFQHTIVVDPKTVVNTKSLRLEAIQK